MSARRCAVALVVPSETSRLHRQLGMMSYQARLGNRKVKQTGIDRSSRSCFALCLAWSFTTYMKTWSLHRRLIAGRVTHRCLSGIRRASAVSVWKSVACLGMLR